MNDFLRLATFDNSEENMKIGFFLNKDTNLVVLQMKDLNKEVSQHIIFEPDLSDLFINMFLNFITESRKKEIKENFSKLNPKFIEFDKDESLEIYLQNFPELDNQEIGYIRNIIYLDSFDLNNHILLNNLNNNEKLKIHECYISNEEIIFYDFDGDTIMIFDRDHSDKSYQERESFLNA